ncbi:Zinc carboxypeptidase [uncultured archaeon]|nr:Zinc carboxypeptidase [uncultured archaeon]
MKPDQPSVLPNWTDGDYHDYFGTTEMLNNFNEKYPDLVKVFSIGKSVLGKNIWCIRVTNEKNNTIKSSCLIDGCIHGSEWEGGEACLYLSEYLLINFDANKTITHILNSSEVYIIPLENPDGRQKDDRFNDNGIDLNRNFDVDFGRIRGGAIPLGKLFGRIKIPRIPFNGARNFTLLYKLFPSFPLWVTNCGRYPFSEPESQAMRDFMRELAKNDFSFYVNCHTATHSINVPWYDIVKPPFTMTEQETNLFHYVLNWVGKNTEYEPVSVLTDKGKRYYDSGTVFDWVFKEFRIPSFCFEILSTDYEPLFGEGKHDNLVHWMQTTLPFFMYLLVNIDNLRLWRTPDIQPLLPEGMPPEPLQ